MEGTMARIDRIWLDSAATTPLAAEVAEAMGPWLSAGVRANPSSLHAEGRAARSAVEQVREQLAEIAGVPPRQVHFTGSASEANNLAIAGSLRAMLDSARPHRVVTSALEHESVDRCLQTLEAEGIAQVTRVPGRCDGRPDTGAAEEALAQGPVLVSLMQVNNETGVIQPIEQWAAAARAANPDIVIHCDAVQALPRMPVAWDAADLITLSGHKAHGPPGIGALIRRRPQALAPLILGGHQEGGLRAGTEPVAQIVGLGEAVRLAEQTRPFITVQLHMLAQVFLGTLLEAGVQFEENCAESSRVPGMLSLRFPRVEGDDLVIAADLDGVALSAASACLSGTPERSHVLRAMGLSDEDIRHTVRIAFHRDQVADDACQAAERLAAIVARAIAP
jgi:cysteine desulfurase